MTRKDLQDGWVARAVAGPVPSDVPASFPAEVPGSVHTDLLTAGIIPDPYLDANESIVQWIGRSDFAYETSFDASFDRHERVDLVCEGLDTVATIEMNGTRLGMTRNQHRSYRFDVREVIHPKDNELRVTFASALNAAEQAEARLGHKPYVGNAHPYNAIRKTASNFGWDWGPTLITAGIWRPIYLHAWSTGRLAGVVPLATVSPTGEGTVSVSVRTERTTDRPLTVRARLCGHGVDEVVSLETTESATSLGVHVDRAQLWWPRGYGEQPLYQLVVELLDDGTLLDSFERNIGFRRAEVRSEPDEFGTGFAFYINDQRVLIKGANWIPDDCFPTRVTPGDYAAGVSDAVEAGFNLLRVWGGGIYESDVLYDLCDRAGVMVWQDFLFACAAYSEDDELWNEVEAEARENMSRLAPHPSLVFYNGSNENVEGYYEWGWKASMAPGEDWGNGYYERLLPAVLAEIDPTRPYRPSSPFSPHDPTVPRDPDHGTVHSWEVWNRQDYEVYRESVPRFVSEFGFQGPPNYPTLTRAVHDDPIEADSPGVLAHQKAQDGNGKLERGFAQHLPVPTSFDDWHFTTQLNQARAITFGIEHFRSHFPRTGGSIIWQLNDCWPVTSWAAVDGDRRRKPLWYALRALNAQRVLTFQPRDEGVALIAGNDTAEGWTERIRVRRIGLDGSELATQDILIDVKPRDTATLVIDPGLIRPSDPRRQVLLADSAHARRAFWYFVEDTELDLPPLRIESAVRRTECGYSVDLRADVFVKDLALNPDRLDASATVSDMLITLLPGESTSLTVTVASAIDEVALVSHPVLQSVNQLREHSLAGVVD